MSLLFVTPDETRTYGERVAAWAEETDLDVRRSGIDPITLSRWASWLNTWGIWWATTNQPPPYYPLIHPLTWGATHDEIERWHEELQGWRSDLAAKGVSFTRTQPTPGRLELPELGGASLGLGLVAGVALVLLLLPKGAR